MIYKLSEAKILWSARYKSSMVFKVARILLPVDLAGIVILSVAAIAFEMQILFLLVAIMAAGLMPLLYFRFGLADDIPDMTIADWKKDPERLNITQVLSSSCIEILREGENLARQHNQPMSGKWVFGAMLRSSIGSNILLRVMVFGKYETFQIDKVTETSPVENILSEAVKFAEENGGKYIEVEDLLAGLAKCELLIKNILVALKQKEDAVLEVAKWYRRWRSQSETLPFWKKPVDGGVGQDWAYGYTNLLSQFAVNLTRVATSTSRHIELFSKTSYVESIERILARSGKNNVILVGDPGVGKKTVIMALARKIMDGQVLQPLRYKQVMQVNVGAILSGANNDGEIAARIEGVLNDCIRAGNVILYLEDFHALVSSRQEVGTINAAEIFMPYLESSRVQVIASTSADYYHRDIERSMGIAGAFERIDIPEANADEAMKILEELVPSLEGKYGVLFTYPGMKEIISLGERYLHDKPFPQKAIDLADEVAVKVSANKKTIVIPSEVQEVITARTHVPVGEVQSTEKEKLLKLEEILHKRVVGQEEAINATADALRRARAGLSDKKRPIGTFLFLGPTGVGKTETAKALAEAYYGSEDRMIRLDMSEYQDERSVYRLLGEPMSVGDNASSGLLATAVKDNPFTLILLDELEKAHANILTLFLQIFDDGRLTGNDGKTVDFTNTIIIATSNAGSEVIRQYISSGKNDMDILKQQLLEYLQSKGIYRPEFLNRFDGVIAFRPLRIDEMGTIVDLMIDSVNKNLAEKNISVNLSSKAKAYLVEKGYDPVFGARPMRRLIQDSVQNVLAKLMLSQEIQPGTVIELAETDLGLKINN